MNKTISCPLCGMTLIKNNVGSKGEMSCPRCAQVVTYHILSDSEIIYHDHAPDDIIPNVVQNRRGNILEDNKFKY